MLRVRSTVETRRPTQTRRKEAEQECIKVDEKIYELISLQAPKRRLSIDRCVVFVRNRIRLCVKKQFTESACTSKRQEPILGGKVKETYRLSTMCVGQAPITHHQVVLPVINMETGVLHTSKRSKRRQFPNKLRARPSHVPPITTGAKGLKE